LETLLADFQIVIEPVSANQAKLALAAYDRFGKGTGHSAGLNYGDCFAYALAQETGEPLLFKGNDFIHTDLERA
jgi:ribonuclease VapC